MKAKFYEILSSSKSQTIRKVVGISMMLLAVGLTSGNVQVFDIPTAPF